MPEHSQHKAQSPIDLNFISLDLFSFKSYFTK